MKRKVRPTITEFNPESYSTKTVEEEEEDVRSFREALNTAGDYIFLKLSIEQNNLIMFRLNS